MKSGEERLGILAHFDAWRRWGEAGLVCPRLGPLVTPRGSWRLEEKMASLYTTPLLNGAEDVMYSHCY